MRKNILRTVILSALVLVFAGCGKVNQKQANLAEPIIISDEKYNVAIVKTSVLIRRPSDELEEMELSSYNLLKDGKTFVVNDDNNYSTVFIIKGYRCFDNGFIEVIAKDGHKYIGSSDNIILMYEPDIKE